MATYTFYGNLQYYLTIPTENDHYGSGYGGVGAGMIPQEKTFNPLIAAQSPIAGHVVSGFAPPSSGTFSSPYVVGTVTAGEAVVNGYRVVGESTISVNFIANKTNYLFLELELDANSRVYRPVLHVNDTSYSRPSNSIPLGEVECDTNSIISTVDLRQEHKVVYGAGASGGVVITSRGSGDWSSSRASAGSYDVTFSPAFAFTPPVVFAQGAQAPVTITNVTKSGFTVTMGLPTDGAWHFIAYS